MVKGYVNCQHLLTVSSKEGGKMIRRSIALAVWELTGEMTGVTLASGSYKWLANIVSGFR